MSFDIAFVFVFISVRSRSFDEKCGLILLVEYMDFGYTYGHSTSKMVEARASRCFDSQVQTAEQVSIWANFQILPSFQAPENR